MTSKARVECGDGQGAVAVRHGQPIESSPAVANGIVHIGSGDDNVYAVSSR